MRKRALLEWDRDDDVSVRVHRTQLWMWVQQYHKPHNDDHIQYVMFGSGYEKLFIIKDFNKPRRVNEQNAKQRELD
jgi:hypothetical protein